MIALKGDRELHRGLRSFYITSRTQMKSQPIKTAFGSKTVEIVSTKAESDNSSKKSSTENLSYQLFEAVCDSDTLLAQKLIDAGADVNYSYKSPEYTTATCLICAIDNGNLEMIAILLQNGADIHLCDGQGETPLTTAVFTGKVELVEALVNHGADINLQSGMCGNTPLMDVLRVHEDTAIIDSLLRFLLRHGADPYKKNPYGENLFVYARTWPKQLPPELIEKPKRNWLGALGHNIREQFQRK